MWPFKNDGPSFASDTFRHKPSINQRIRMLSISHSCSNHSSLEMEAECLTKTLSHLMMICGWTPLTSQHRPENDHERQCICQIRYEKMRGVRLAFQICLFYTSQTRDSTLQPIKLHYFTKQRYTRFSFFVLICAYRQNFVIKTTFKYRVDPSHFFMPYLADALPFMVIFWSML